MQSEYSESNYSRRGRGRDHRLDNRRFDRGYGENQSFDRRAIRSQGCFGDEQGQERSRYGLSQSEFSDTQYGEGRYGEGRYGEGRYGESWGSYSGPYSGYRRHSSRADEYSNNATERDWQDVDRYRHDPYEQRTLNSQDRRGSEQWRTQGRSSFPTTSSSAFGRTNGSFGRHTGKGPKGYRRSDEQIKDEVCQRLEQDGDVDASQIEVKCQDGVVRLEGKISDREMKRCAEDCADEVYGVKDVMNSLTCESGSCSSSSKDKSSTERSSSRSGN